MELLLAQSGISTKRSLATLGKLILAALAVKVLIYLALIVVEGPQIPFLVHIAVVLVIGGLVRTGFRWTPAVAALHGMVFFTEALTFLSYLFTRPPTTFDFASAIAMAACSAVEIGAGIGATVQNYRRAPDERHAPAWTGKALLMLVACAAGAILTPLIQQRPAVAAGISPAVLVGLPEVRTKDFRYSPAELRAKQGETVVLRLANADDQAHFFEIDEFNVHATMPAGKESIAIFKPTRPGTYTFYCGPHANKTAGSGMIGKLVVAP